MSQKIALILSGCGYLDGAEIRESVLTILALDSQGISYDIFAPNRETFHVIDHLKGEEVQEKRNILTESARIARGNVSDLETLKTENYKALIMPGGFGVAKNLCDFAFKGVEASVDELVDSIIKKFNNEKKPIGAICITPALVALSLGKLSPTLTIGNDQGTADALENLGAKHKNCAPNEIAVDNENKIVSTPAYMYDDALLSDINVGIHSLVKEVNSLAQA